MVRLISVLEPLLGLKATEGSEGESDSSNGL